MLHEVVALQILALLLEKDDEESTLAACALMTECGAILAELNSQGANLVFDQLRSKLQEGTVSKRCQYVIEALFKVRKDRFRSHPAVAAELNLVPVEERVTHQLELDDERVGSKENCAD